MSLQPYSEKFFKGTPLCYKYFTYRIFCQPKIVQNFGLPNKAIKWQLKGTITEKYNIKF